MTDQLPLKCEAETLGSRAQPLTARRGPVPAERRQDAPAPATEAVSDAGPDFDIADRDPIHQAAREVVRALVANHWSLSAAAFVVALHRLRDAVDLTDGLAG